MRSFDLHPDGQRIVMAVPVAAPAAQPRDRVILVFNFVDELRRLAPVK